MTNWWNALVGVEKIFWIIAIPSTVLFIFQMILLVLGLDVDGDGDFDFHDMHTGSVEVNDFDLNHEGEFSFSDVKSSSVPLKLITIRNVIIFSTIFSWSGITFLEKGKNLFFTIVISTIIATTVIGIITTIFALLIILQEKGNINIENAINKEGKVYLTIPEEEKGSGKIEITFQGRYQVVEAITLGEKIKTGSSIKVVGIKNGMLLVKEYLEHS
ncbi:hypothetical protein [Clostridium grantii]|uniref:NfeD-like C-terminal, partner-binding n=1 Tax=Clostridium grantii DSM 8605 TaxID=1121316 RepID=A0A1M5QF42_9CLOT|nr:hypothetical protein [Clostridium grantii]SHH12476.1 hypothetical protein SAMN02745207_00041 [Clostridium grantii DSM 8605]